MAEDRKEKFLKELAIRRGIVTDACNATGIARSTYYHWRQNDKAFAVRCDDVAEEAIDFVESKLLQNIEDGKEASAIFYLKTKAKHRGYVERQEHSGPAGKPLVPETMPLEETARRTIFGLLTIENREKAPQEIDESSETTAQ